MNRTRKDLTVTLPDFFAPAPSWSPVAPDARSARPGSAASSGPAANSPPAVPVAPTRVAHVIHSGGFYGAERVVCDLAREQSSDPRFAPAVIAFLDPGKRSNEIADRAAAMGLDVIRVTVPQGFSPAGLRAYAHALAVCRARVVHSHGYKPTLYHLAARALGLARGIKLLVTAHGYPKGSGGIKATLYRLLDIVLLGAADGVVAVSEEMRAYLSLRNPWARVVSIGNGIPTGLRAAGRHPLRKAFPGTEPIIGTAGRLVPMKNHALLIRAYALLRRSRPCRLVILGEGPLRASLEALWHDLIPDEPPCLLPFKPDVLEWMADMDVFAMPSNDGEGLPIALLEAALLERPVVCSRSGGMPEVVRDGENGRLFDIGDGDGLVKALDDLLADFPLRRSYGEALRNEVLRAHDIRTTHARYAEAYAEILARR